MPTVQYGSYWEADLQGYLASVRERESRPPPRRSRARRILRAAPPRAVTFLSFLALPLLYVLPVAFPYSGGLLFMAILLLWYLVMVVDVALVCYLLLSGRPPTWAMVMARVRMLRRPIFRW